MKVISISSAYPNYAKKSVVNQKVSANHEKANRMTAQPSFKSDAGALIGMGIGALTGIGAAVLVVATGGIAAPLVAVGAAGAGAGAQVGGIIGGLVSGKEEDAG